MAQSPANIGYQTPLEWWNGACPGGPLYVTDVKRTNPAGPQNRREWELLRDESPVW